MGQLAAPVLPDLLYRYRSLTDRTIAREIDMIREQVLWCSYYKDLNDPMEGFYDPTTRVQKHDTYTVLARNIFSEKQTVGICCLTDTPDNELMWTHYAKNYSGICVSYRPRKLLMGIPENASLVRLGYGIAPPTVGIGDTANLHSAALKILSHKKASWSYEREWRVLAERGALRIATEQCVRDVLLGSRIPSAHRRQIEHALGDLPVRISTMNISRYAHTWTLIKTLKGELQAAE